MNPSASHLTDAQIRDYITDSTIRPVGQQGVEAHLESCESCRNRALEAERIDLSLLEGDVMQQAPYPGCPAEETLQELAAGISDPAMAEATTEHAAHCTRCGPMLSRYMREFSDDLQAEDAEILTQLKTAVPGWQKKFVRENFSQPKKSWFGFWPKLATAAAAAAVAGYVFLVPNDLSKAQQLVAAAYKERRITDMRFPSAPFADRKPNLAPKGETDSGNWESEPAPLLEAQTLLRKKRAGDLTPQWLQVDGRVHLLQGNTNSIDQAIEAFEKARLKSPEDQSLKVDLAAAYFEKEMLADDQPPVLMKTIELLTDVVKNSKENQQDLKANALFDLAIAYEKSQSLNLAVSTWKEYLAIDSSSDWAKEAQKHLNDLKGREPPRLQQGYETPAYFLAHAYEPAILSDLEGYQDIALQSWLAVAVEDPNSEAARAVVKLAQLLRQQHSDPWLQDFLGRAGLADLPAVKLLAAAFAYDLKDLHHQAIQESQKAAAIFAAHHNFPGELRARYQEVYGLQRSLAGGDCLERSDELWVRLFKTGYHWLQAQLALARAACSNLTLDFNTAANDIERGRDIAGQFRLPELASRVAGFDAGIQKQQENYDAAWKKAVAGLELYWQGKCPNELHPAKANRNECPYSWERAYQFYSVMQQCARNTGLSHASEALLHTQISLIEDNVPEDASLKAALYLRLANLLLQQGQEPLAVKEASKAESLLRDFPRDESAAQIYAAMTRIELAEFYLKRGNGELALSKITPLRGLLAKQDDFVKLDFYTVEGDIYRQMKRLDQAVSAYQSGIQVAESSLHNEQEGARLNWISATGKTYSGLTRALLDLGQTTQALSVWEWSLARSLVKRDNAFPELRNSKAAKQFAYPPLPSPSETHLVYATFHDGIQVWIVNGDRILGKWLSVQSSELKKTLVEFAKECSDPSRPVVQAQALYSLLVQPVIDDLSHGSTVVLELDTTLWGLTFQALQDRAGHYFGEDYAVAYSPGLLAEATLRQPRVLTVHDAMLLVDASQSLDAAPLPGHLEEVAAVEDTFVNTKIVGPAAITASEVRQALPQSLELHFTGHGKQNGSGTALVIGSQTFLEARDFVPERLRRLQMVVLSACSSGLSKNGPLDQSNLVRSFLAGKVPTVIASHWDVDSKSTAHLMRIFYSRLRNGEPAVEALQHAEAEMRSLDSHPYYWAAFTLTGRVN